MEYTAYKALEQFKKQGFIMLLFLMNMGIQRVITLNDILEALVEMHQIFYRDEFQLVERRWKLVG
jgi:hypothetical protein